MPTPQRPLGSGFDAASTASEVIGAVDLRGRMAIVTGGYAGIGRETVRVLAAAGASVVVPARDLAKARAALADVAHVEIEPLDLMDPRSVDAFATRFLATGRPLHLLINNAGIMAPPLVRDARGYESQFATNHLGHYQLTTRLWPALRQADGARVVSLTSRGHFYSPVVFDDVQFERRPYDPWKGYGQSKTANVLFAVGADARGASEGIRAFAVHPGIVVETELARNLSPDYLRAAGSLDAEGRPVLDPARNRKTIPQGAATTVWCATSAALDGMGGVYCENCDIAAPVPAAAIAEQGAAAALVVAGGVMPYAIDRAAADQLWALSRRLLDGPG